MISMKRSEFPLDCKVTKPKPLYKKGSKKDPKKSPHYTLLTCFRSYRESYS